MSTLNVKEAADMLCVHPNTVFKLIDDCVIPAARIGRAYVLLEKHVLDYLENQVVIQTAKRMGLPQPRSKV